MPPHPPFPPPLPGTPPAGTATDSRRTGAAWAGLCGVGHGMDFGVGALILGVIMIGPPKSEKLKAPHCGDATAAGNGPAPGVGAGPPVRGSCGPPIPFLPGFGCQVTVPRFSPDMAAVVQAWDQAPAVLVRGPSPLPCLGCSIRIREKNKDCKRMS